MPTDFFDILKQYGLAGLVIIGLGVALKVVYSQKEELVKILIEMVKSSAQATSENAKAMDNVSETMLEVKNMMISHILKEKENG